MTAKLEILSENVVAEIRSDEEFATRKGAILNLRNPDSNLYDSSDPEIGFSRVKLKTKGLNAVICTGGGQTTVKEETLGERGFSRRPVVIFGEYYTRLNPVYSHTISDHSGKLIAEITHIDTKTSS